MFITPPERVLEDSLETMVDLYSVYEAGKVVNVVIIREMTLQTSKRREVFHVSME